MPKRTIRGAKPASKPTAETTVETTVPAEATDKRIARNVTRDAETILRGRYNFSNVTARDESYARMLADCGADKRPVPLADIAAKYQRNPFYAGSAKSTDAGAFERLIKADLIVFDGEARTAALTDRGKHLAALVIKRASA